MILSATDWAPSLHNLGTQILWSTGLDAHRAKEVAEPERAVQFTVHSNKSPFKETNRIIASNPVNAIKLEYYQHATTVFDLRDKPTQSTFAVMLGVGMAFNPYKLVHIVYSKTDETKLPEAITKQLEPKYPQ